MRPILVLVLLSSAAAAQDPAVRYPELQPADRGDEAKFRALEDAVNGWFDTEVAEKRAARLKEIEGSGYGFRVVDAVVRHGRRYAPVEGKFVGNVTVPAGYDPLKPVPVLVGMNGLTDALERTATADGFATIHPWKVDAWVDPRTTDRVAEQLWEASKTLNLDFDRVYGTGVSVGGHGTWIAGAARTDVWAALMPVSGSPGRIMVAMSEAYLANLKHLPVRATVGADDDEIADMAKRGQSVAKRFELPCTLDVVAGRGHDSFEDRSEDLLAWAGAIRRERYPAKLDFYGGGDLGTRHYWVEVLDSSVRTKDLEIEAVTKMITRQIPVAPFHVQAEIKGQTIVIFTKEVKSLRVSLSDEMLDLDKELSIKVNGTVRWKGKPGRSVQALLESSLRRKDRSRTFAVEREFDCTK